MNIAKKLKKILKILGPGFISGASDDDPSGIATYSQTGAQFGYGLLWTVLMTSAGQLFSKMPQGITRITREGG